MSEDSVKTTISRVMKGGLPTFRDRRQSKKSLWAKYSKNVIET